MYLPVCDQCGLVETVEYFVSVCTEYSRVSYKNVGCYDLQDNNSSAQIKYNRIRISRFRNGWDIDLWIGGPMRSLLQEHNGLSIIE